MISIIIAYTGYVHVQPNQGLAGVAITDNEYPQNVAFDVIAKMLATFSSRFSKLHWAGMEKKDLVSLSLPQLSEMLRSFQDPTEANALLKVQKTLDETRTVLTTTIEALLERGEKLDTLVEKSEQISTQSKAFYKVAKKTNSCCWIQ